MGNDMDKIFSYAIFVCIVFISLSIIDGGYYNENFRMYVSFGRWNEVLGCVGLSFSFSMILILIYDDIRNKFYALWFFGGFRDS